MDCTQAPGINLVCLLAKLFNYRVGMEWSSFRPSYQRFFPWLDLQWVHDCLQSAGHLGQIAGGFGSALDDPTVLLDHSGDTFNVMADRLAGGGLRLVGVVKSPPASRSRFPTS
jgi:hypothetical protein